MTARRRSVPWLVGCAVFVVVFVWAAAWWADTPDGGPVPAPVPQVPPVGPAIGDVEGDALRFAALVSTHQRVEFYGWLATSTTTTVSVPTESPSTGPPVALPPAGGSVWDALAACEAGGNWAHPPVGPLPGNPSVYSGGLMFDHRYWPGPGLPYQASRARQIEVAEDILATNGWQAWPACSKRLGLR